jgi:hypothetical protein
LERLYPGSHGGIGGDRLLHGGSAYAKRVDYVLRAVFHSFGEPEDMLGRSHPSSGSRVDGTDGTQCDDGRCWFSDQAEIIRDLATPKQAGQSDANEIAEAVFKRFGDSGAPTF